MHDIYCSQNARELIKNEQKKHDGLALKATLLNFRNVSRWRSSGSTTFQYEHIHRTHENPFECLHEESLSDFSNCLHSRRKPFNQTMFFDPNLVPQIHRLIPDIKSVLDFGSASGAYLRHHFTEFGVRAAVGLEPDLYLGPITHYVSGWDSSSGPVQLHPPSDANKEASLLRVASCFFFGAAEQQFDLVTSFEVFEHIPRRFHCELLNTLALHTKRWFVGSIARIGQAGRMHIACRSQQDFVAEWEMRGFYHHAEVSAKLRRALNVSWFRRNIVVLEVSPRGRRSVYCA